MGYDFDWCLKREKGKWTNKMDEQKTHNIILLLFWILISISVLMVYPRRRMFYRGINREIHPKEGKEKEPRETTNKNQVDRTIRSSIESESVQLKTKDVYYWWWSHVGLETQRNGIWNGMITRVLCGLSFCMHIIKYEVENQSYCGNRLLKPYGGWIKSDFFLDIDYLWL